MTATYGASVAKPDMAVLKGEWGRRVFEAIARAQKPDLTELERRCRESEETIRRAKENGTY